MRDQVTQMVLDGFGYLGDLLEPAEYQVLTTGYDPVTGKATQSMSNTALVVFQDTWTWSDRQNLDIDSQDKKYLFMLQNLDDVNIVPRSKDKLKVNGVAYCIKEIIDNTGILCTVQVVV